MHYTILYYTILTILYYTILYHTILYQKILVFPVLPLPQCQQRQAAACDLCLSGSAVFSHEDQLLKDLPTRGLGL